MSEHETLPVSVIKTGQQPLSEMMRLAADLERNANCFSTNLPVGDNLGLSLQMKLTGPADLRSEDAIGTVFQLAFWMVRPAEFVNSETGEVTNGVRVTLADAAGKTISAASIGVYDSLCRLVSFAGPGPWTPPIPIMLREVRTRQGRKMLVFDVVSPSVG
jgi:hypothetical protein